MIATVKRAASVTEKIESVGDRTYRFVVSSKRADRIGDVVDPNGIDATDFLENPVMMWAHEHDGAPLGTWKNLHVEGDLYLADAEFLAPGIDERADRIHEMVRANVVRGASIAYFRTDVRDPSSRAERAELGLGPRGEYVAKCTLLEISLCSLPMNARALRKALGGCAPAVLKSLLAAEGALEQNERLDSIENNLERLLAQLEVITRAVSGEAPSVSKPSEQPGSRAKDPTEFYRALLEKVHAHL